MADEDRLMALEFGRVFDGQLAANWRDIGENFGFLHDGSDGPVVGFGVDGFSGFNVDDPDVAAIWTDARFEVPLLGLPAASAGEIILAARPLLGDHSTINRELFDAAISSQDEDPRQALSMWLACLEAGDSMAHFALGYTLFDLGRYREAYRHLRYYAQISPGAAWNWCWLGKAAQAIGELDEAIQSYARAVELADEEETDAPLLLAELKREIEATRVRVADSGTAGGPNWPLTVKEFAHVTQAEAQDALRDPRFVRAWGALHCIDAESAHWTLLGEPEYARALEVEERPMLDVPGDDYRPHEGQRRGTGVPAELIISRFPPTDFNAQWVLRGWPDDWRDDSIDAFPMLGPRDRAFGKAVNEPTSDKPTDDGWKKFGDEEPPHGPPPDENQPYMWLDGQWVLLASDTADGIPQKLEFGGD
jgi:tetratricopeptide (TPR) repeat protein